MTCLLLCTAEGQYKQEDRHATDFQVFANSQKLVKRGGKEKITPVLRFFLFLVWRKWGLLLQSIIHSDVKKLSPLALLRESRICKKTANSVSLALF